MAMLDLLCREGYYCEVAHVNFQLRGDDSNLDADLVASVCVKHDLRLHTKTIDTQQYADEHKLSVEMAAREIRYRFFEEIMNQRNLDYVAVAHHRNDVVETFFINLMRGTGLRGLTGIAPKNGCVVRPLLSLSHPELIAYLEEQHLEYRTDKTNFDTTILRNEIRHHFIPELENRKPGFTEIMQRTIGQLRESDVLVEAYVSEWKKNNVRVINDELIVPMPALYGSASSSEILFRMLQPMGFSSAIIDELSQEKERRVGACFECEDYILVVDRENIIVSQKCSQNDVFYIEKGVAQVQMPISMTINQYLKTEQFVLKKNSEIAIVDVDKLSFPLVLRHWQKGDVFYPIGMGGKRKKVSDYFIDQKFSVPQKRKTWLLCSGDAIVWIVGHRLDERFKVTEQARAVMEICV